MCFLIKKIFLSTDWKNHFGISYVSTCWRGVIGCAILISFSFHFPFIQEQENIMKLFTSINLQNLIWNTNKKSSQIIIKWSLCKKHKNTVRCCESYANKIPKIWPQQKMLINQFYNKFVWGKCTYIWKMQHRAWMGKCNANSILHEYWMRDKQGKERRNLNWIFGFCEII